MNSFSYSYNHESSFKDDSLDPQLFSTTDGFNQWMHFGGNFEEDNLRDLLTQIGLHNLWIDNVFESENTIAPIDFDSGILLFLRSTSYSSDPIELNLNLVNIIWLPGGVITVSKDPITTFDPIHPKLRQKSSGIRSNGSAFLLYKILDSFSNQYIKTVSIMEDELEDIELQMINDTHPALLDRLHQISKDIVSLRKCTTRLNETIEALFDLESNLINDLKPYFEDVNQRVLNLGIKLRSLKDQLANLLQLNLNLMGMRTNEIVTFLTIISSIFIPLSFLAGLYGMNFANMPELQWKYGYYYLLCLMLGVVIVSFGYFKRKNWI